MYKENYPVIQGYDVIVAGGGTAGAAAAIAAGRRGRRVLLLENQAFLGGMASGGMISQFMGFAEGVTTETVSGVMGDILGRLIQMGAAKPIETIYLSHREDLNVSAAPYDPEALKVVLDDLTREAGVDVLLHTRVIAAEREGARITGLLIHNTAGISRVEGEVYIDATFHGSLAAEAGCDWVKGDEAGRVQPGTLMFRLTGVDMDRFAALSFAEKDALGKRGVQEGALFTTSILCRPIYPGLSYCNMSRVQVDALVPEDLSRAEAEGRVQVQKILAFLRENVPGLAGAQLAGAGVYLGLRDSRRICGLHYLTAEEILHGKRFADTVAVSSYPIDIHDPEGAESIVQKPEGGDYYIPYGVMVSDRVENLIFTGRCVSADREAHAAIRVMATCVQLGQAAGIAAAESLNQSTPPNRLDGRIVSAALFS